MIRVNNFNESGLVLSDVSRIDPAIEAKYDRTRLRGGEILLTIVGSVGQVAIAPPKVAGFNVARAVAVMHPRDEADTRWLAMCLGSPLSQRLLGNSANTTVQTTINLKDLRALPIPMPPPFERDRLVALFAPLDDRIALLRETNATLEAIAQALFKSWFVDFDPVRAKSKGRAPEGMDEATAALFPDTFENSPLGPIPTDWRWGTLADCCVRIESGGTPKRVVPSYWNEGIPWLTSGEVREPIISSTTQTISALGVRESAAKLWPIGTVVVAMYGATAGEACLLSIESSANQACCGLLGRPGFREFVFLYVRRERDALAAKSSGSAQQNLNKGVIERHSTLLPHEPFIQSFHEICGPLVETWIANEAQTQTLAALRDELLPRLVSGRLRISDAGETAVD